MIVHQAPIGGSLSGGGCALTGDGHEAEVPIAEITSFNRLEKWRLDWTTMFWQTSNMGAKSVGVAC